MMKVQLTVLLLAVGVYTKVIRNSTDGNFEDSAEGASTVRKILRLDVCHYGMNNTPYDPDTVIAKLPKDCQIVYCDKTGTIENQYPLGKSAIDCCKCHDILYGKDSDTCEFKENFGKCQEGCIRDGKPVGNGELVEILPSQCTKRRCIQGRVVPETRFGIMTGCCLDADDQMRENGFVDNDGGCLEKICTDGDWVPIPKNINLDCKSCTARNDPHFIDFSGVAFDWHVGCNHALIQDGTTMDPEFGVFMDFDRIGSIGVIAGPTTYQEDMNTKVVISNGLNQLPFQLSVNGLVHQVDSSTPKLLIGPVGETTIYAWKHVGSFSTCIRLYGKHNILVELCSGQISIWAPVFSLGHRLPLAGLCGGTTKTALNEKKLVARNGDKFSPSGGQFFSWSPDAPDKFGLSWQVKEQTKDTCPAVKSKIKAANEDIRKACLNDSNSSNQVACLEVVEDAGLTGDYRDNLFYNCLFDLCIAVTDPEAPFTKEEMLEQDREIAAQTKSNIDSTIEFVSVEEKCPNGWSPVGGQCYQIHKYDTSLSLEDAQNNCNADEAILAHPSDVAAINKFIKGSYWLGALHMDGDMEWIIGGGQIPKDQFLIGVPREDPDKPNNCLEIQLPTTNTGKNPQVIVRQHVEIHAKYVKSVKILSKVFYYNGNKELTRVEETDSTMDCIHPELYICEREPLACGDEDDNCAWRALDGECSASKAYMYNACKETCYVPCECDQPETCTEVGGMCLPLDAICEDVSDPTLCSNDNCTCCYFPDPCQDSGDEDCEDHKRDGLCESTDQDIIHELEKHCSRTCGFCESRPCSCSYIPELNGCVLRGSTTAYRACQCSIVNGNTCIGEVVHCADTQSPYCRAPGNDYNHCMQGVHGGKGNCCGYETSTAACKS